MLELVFLQRLPLPRLAGKVLVFATFFLLCCITYCFFVFGERLVDYMGQSAIKVVTRLMGLILAVVGTNMLIEGVYGAVRAFK